MNNIDKTRMSNNIKCYIDMLTYQELLYWVKNSEHFDNYFQDLINKQTKGNFNYYYAQPEFRKRHLEYVKGFVECECGDEVRRYNMSKHKKGVAHQKNMKSLDRKIAELEKLI